MKPKSSKKASKSKPLYNYILILSFFLALLMVVSCIAMLARYSVNIQDESADTAQKNIKIAAASLLSGVEKYKSLARTFGLSVANEIYEDGRDFSTRMSRMSHEEEFGSIAWVRYHSTSIAPGTEDDELRLDNISEVMQSSIDKGVVSCLGAAKDDQLILSSIAYCVPLTNFEYADAVIVSFFVEEVVASSEEFNENFDNSRLTVFCTPEGEIVQILNAYEGITIGSYGDIYSILREEFNDKLFVDEFTDAIKSGETKTYQRTVSGDDCVITVSSCKEDGRTLLSAVGYYSNSDLYPAGYFILRAILGTLLVFFVILIAVTAVLFIQKFVHRKRSAAIVDVNAVLGCYSRAKFERVAEDIVNKNKGTAFAVVVLDITHYSYISNQFDNETTVKILKFLELLCSRNLQLDEEYGYADNGRFLLLLHFRDQQLLEERLNTIVELAGERGAQVAGSLKLALAGGVYTTDKKLTDSVAKMVDLAIEAVNATRFSYDFGTFRYYNETLHSSTVMNDYIELHMEQALVNHDYKVFYQPKYNIAEKRPDGSEALVRWYNSELDEYMQPDVFLPLFEANRFIVKVDHYVFEQVCMYIEDAVLNGLPLVPVSVNASRITASAPDFVDFYIATKQKHNIADGFITIEFTESFAYDDYDNLRNIVNALHKGGFKCSIDDFGSGFSSYSILKELPMDEIKLDRFFIKEGYSQERDLKVLSSIISLARELHMKITQEGVENQDQLLLLKELGCQVIQGYYYSKPLSLTDYTGFLDNKKII